MADAFITDPLGRRIVLLDEGWIKHITVRHPEVAPHRAAVENAIRRPAEIRFSAADHDARLYYGPGPRSGLMIVAVANVKRGYVKTAHFTRAAKGEIEWTAQ